MNAEARFWSKIAISGFDRCWYWAAGMHQKGYGQVWYRGKFNKAHRVMYELENGPIPEGMQVLHSCDNPGCVNPDHLWVGTNLDNRRDSLRKKRHNYGERHGNARLTDQKVLEIRRRSEGARNAQALADEFGVSRCTIDDVVRRRSWKHLRVLGEAMNAEDQRNRRGPAP